MIPMIEFRYSWIYDQKFKDKGKKYSPKKIEEYIKKVKKIWGKYEKDILKELQKISGLKWEEKKIICYIISKTIPFSDPLTIPIYKNKNYFIDVLTHELIHRLFTQNTNREITNRSWKMIQRKLKKENINVRVHVILNAIHKHILLKFFNKKRLNKNIKSLNHLKDYKKSWEIVERQRCENIIKSFKKNLGTKNPR